jgi:hypothetical protein
MKRICVFVLAIGIAAAGLATEGGRASFPAQADRPVRNIGFLTSDADLYCSFFILDALPTLKIVGGDSSRTLFSDGDIVYFKGTGKDVPAEGQVLAVLEPGPKVAGTGKKSSLGPLVFQRGRVRVLRVENGLGTGRVEKACGSLMTGHFLVPFLEKEKVAVKDTGLEGRPWTGGALSGRVIFLEDGAVQIATGQRALIDLGREDGLELGRQLTVFVQGGKDQPFEPSANLVVIDVGKATATVKALRAVAPIRIGDVVQVK